MKDEMFKELLQSVREAGAIMRGEAEPSRVFVMERPDVKSIRSKLGFSQVEFASMMGISVGTSSELGTEATNTKRTGPSASTGCCYPSGSVVGGSKEA